MATSKLASNQDTVERQYKPLSPMMLAWRRFRRNRLAIIGFCIVALFTFVAVFAPVIAPFPYDRTSYNVFRPPGYLPQHILGTDEAGRDFLSRIIWGANTSLTVGVTAQVFVLIVGLTLGFASAWFKGWVDFVVNRLIEVVSSMPGLLFQILIMALIGNGTMNVTFAIAILAWPGMVRLVRSQVLQYKEREFIDAARSMGASAPFIAVRHILPNILNPLLVSITFGIPGFMLAEAGLSFLGRGILEPTPSWGKMLGIAGSYVQSYTYMALIPTVLIVVMFIGFSFFGDGARDALDPASDRA